MIPARTLVRAGLRNFARTGVTNAVTVTVGWS